MYQNTEKIQPNNPHHLEGVAAEITECLSAEDFNEEDRAEVEANRAYFLQRADKLKAAAGQSIRATQYAA